MIDVLVTGGRDYSDRAYVNHVLDAIHRHTRIRRIIEGGATGADSLARAWAKGNHIAVETCEANWDLFGNHAGRMRNAKMLREEKPDLVVAFPGAKGTRHMIEISEKAGVPVFKTSRENRPLVGS